jgi:uncharacterized protein with PQ loop repeat
VKGKFLFFFILFFSFLIYGFVMRAWHRHRTAAAWKPRILIEFPDGKTRKGNPRHH